MQRRESSALPGMRPTGSCLVRGGRGELYQAENSGSNVNKDTQLWHINMLISSQPQIPLVIKSRT